MAHPFLLSPAAVLASDLRTGTPLRVFPLARGGSIAVDHPLSLHPRMFVSGSCDAGFTVTTDQGVIACGSYAGDAVEAAHNYITDLQGGGSC